jgi:hypothetical protein
MWKGKTALRLLISAHKRITGSINRLRREPQRLLRQGSEGVSGGTGLSALIALCTGMLARNF